MTKKPANLKKNKLSVLLIVSIMMAVICGYLIWRIISRNQTIILYKDTNNTCYFEEGGLVSSTKVSRNIVKVEIPKKELTAYYAEIAANNYCVFEDINLNIPVVISN